MNEINNMQPQNIEAEESVLSSCLISKDAMDTATDILVPNDFYRTSHKNVFAAILELIGEKKPIDIVTVYTKLKTKGLDSGAGTLLNSLLDETPPAVNVASYCELVKGESVKRDLINQANNIIQECYSGKPAVSVLDKSQERIVGIEFDIKNVTTAYFRDLIIDRIDYFESLSGKKEQITGIPTGIPEIDTFTCGLQPADLILLAARPSMGKTAWALDIGRNAAKRGYPGLIFSLEMSKEQLTDRAICSEARVDSQKIRWGNLSKEDWEKVTDASGRIWNLPIGIDDSGGLTLAEIRRRSRKAKKNDDIKWVVIDYLQLMHMEKGHSRDREVGMVSAGLKSLAKELKIPFIVLSQLNRSLENRDNKRPRLSDLRESGNLEQDADVVFFLYRPAVYNAIEEFEGQSEIILAKQRNGPAGKSIKVIFRDKYTCFDSYSVNNEYS